ncbi:Ig-like domain-containing protein [Catenovulum sediminis]|uniref:Ig-like domain-containing protein n=1 Tax=Catenovulum sediminis TaxID=1740262 RepID=A0ABV1RDF8_9ALTE
MTLDNAAPSALTITTPIETDSIVNAAEDEDVLIVGTGAENNASVTVTITDNNSSVSRTVTADGSGNWTLSGSELDVSGLNNGTLTVSATQTDEAGNTSTAATQNIILDNAAPSAPSITTPIEIDNIVNASEDDSVLISGSGAEANASLTITVGSVSIQTTADSSGNWTIESNEIDISALNNGSLTVSVTQTDAAGNTSSSGTSTITLDNTAPSAPVITTPIETDGIVNAAEDEDVLIAGNGAEADNSVTVTITDNNNSTVSRTVTADSSGNWTIAGSELDVSTFNNGTLTVTATQTDDAGNTSTAASTAVTLDNQVPTVTLNALQTNDNTPSLNGTLDDIDADVTITVGSQVYNATNNANGSWTLADDTLAVLADGTYDIEVKATDASGNVATDTTINELEIDATIPSGFTMTIEQSLIDASNDSAMSFQFTDAEVGSKYQAVVSDGNNNVTVNGIVDTTDMQVSDINVSSLDEGMLTISVTLTDNFGNQSEAVTGIVEKLYQKAPEIIEGDTVQVSMSEDANPTAFALVLNAIDANEDILSWSVQTGPSNGAASVGNTGNQVEVNYQPNSNFNGNDSFIIQVSDGIDTASITVNVNINAVNDNPIISGTPPTSIAEDNTYSFVPSASDIDSNSLIFSITNAPSWATFDINTGALTGTPTNSDVGTSKNIVISVTDGLSTTRLAPFELMVSNVNDAPVGENINVTTLEDTSINIEPVIRDDDGDSLSLSIVSSPNLGVLNQSGMGWHYQPSEHENGLDSFTYRVADGQAFSETYTVNINVTAVNDEPIAADDLIALERIETDAYTLDVLANDFDVDGDTLIIEGAKTSVGTVSIQNGQLQFQAPDNFIGSANLTYSVRDGNKGRDNAIATVTISGEITFEPPEITPPSDKEINAKGLLTKVDLGVATAVDAQGNPLPVSLVDGVNVFAPGTHTVYWQAEDSLGGLSTAQQQVDVHPLISLSKDQVVTEGSKVTVKVLLNGASPVYPLEIPFSVGGSASADEDHTLTDGIVSITSGTQANITFDVLSDSDVELDENIIITLGSADSLNLGANRQSRIRISETNIAPNVNLAVSQNNESRLTVTTDGGMVRIAASVTDPNPTDTVLTEWQADNNLVNTSIDDLMFEFDPSGLTTGIYKVSLEAVDTGSLTDSGTVYIDVRESLQVLTDIDSDGDLIPDVEEGYADSDGDGIPDFLDAINDCNVIPESVNNQNGFLVEGDPGVCLRRGSISALGDSGGLLVSNDEVQNLGVDEQAQIVNGMVDFIAYGLPEAGQTYQLVFPQRSPIPLNAIYRKYSESRNEWFTFESDDDNKLYSSEGEPGICPPPGDDSWIEGLNAGHWCVQLVIKDGGIYDDDGEENGAIVDPGGVAVELNGNAQPVAVDDSAELRWNTSIEIDVLSNDTDTDQDPLRITSATASFGQITNIDGSMITYQPNANFAGSDTVTYAITDDQGGTASAKVAITVIPNRAPLATADSAATTHKQPIEIDVLSNDTDPDGDNIRLTSVSANVGSAEIVNGMIKYTPELGRSGEFVVSYQIEDIHELLASSTATVTVTGNDAPEAVDDSISIDGSQSVEINVLDNDTDVNSDPITIQSASATYGAVTILNNKIIRYVPKADYAGIDTIRYTVSDSYGGVSQAQVRVDISGPEVITVTNRSSGGSTSNWGLIGLLLAGMGRKLFNTKETRNDK